MTKHEDKNEQPLCKDANHERSIRFTSELIHEFTNMVTAVIGYSELALHAIEDSHPARQSKIPIQRGNGWRRFASTRENWEPCSRN